jgi:hypothetical protein
LEDTSGRRQERMSALLRAHCISKNEMERKRGNLIKYLAEENGKNKMKCRVQFLVLYFSHHTDSKLK